MGLAPGRGSRVPRGADVSGRFRCPFRVLSRGLQAPWSPRSVPAAPGAGRPSSRCS